MLVMLGILIPTATSADLQSSVSGISPTLDPNEEYSVEINVTTNSLLIWFWDAQGYGSIEFWIETPNGTIVDFPSSPERGQWNYGMYSEDAGQYGFFWKNCHSIYTMKITYVIINLIPFIELTSPEPGSTITDLTPMISRDCDEYVPSIMISTNNSTYYEAQRDGTEWSSNV